MEALYGKTLIAKNETRWNSQQKMIHRVVEVDVDKVVEKLELSLTSYEKAVLRELVEVLELFEEATDILQGDLYLNQPGYFLIHGSEEAFGRSEHSPQHSIYHCT